MIPRSWSRFETLQIRYIHMIWNLNDIWIYWRLLIHSVFWLSLFWVNLFFVWWSKNILLDLWITSLWLRCISYFCSSLNLIDNSLIEIWVVNRLFSSNCCCSSDSVLYFLDISTELIWCIASSFCLCMQSKLTILSFISFLDILFIYFFIDLMFTSIIRHIILIMIIDIVLTTLLILQVVF